MGVAAFRVDTWWGERGREMVYDMLTRSYNFDTERDPSHKCYGCFIPNPHFYTDGFETWTTGKGFKFKEKEVSYGHIAFLRT